MPHFDTYSNWREVRIVSRESTSSTSAHSVSSIAQSVPRSHPWDPNVVIRTTDNVKHTESDDAEFMSAQSDTATRNSIIIRLKGQVEITATPLLLEGLQR